MSIQVNSLTKIYGIQKAVNNISFEIETSEIVGFMGPNGAGKSTTMKMLTCYIPPTSGEAKVCGLDVSDQSIQVRKHVGYLPEHNPLYLDMYVREYLAFAAGLGGVKNVNERVDEVIALTHLGKEKHKKIGQLSRGYRQRVGLAQAIIHDPDVLILDEPTSGLDPNQVMEIRDLIKNLGSNKTIMLSTHIMQEVEAICSRVIIIDKGVIVADDKLENLRNRSEGKWLVRVQFASVVSGDELKKIQGLLELTALGDNTWRLAGDNMQFRQAVSQFALSSNLEVTELVSEKDSMESIFRQLTGHVDNL
ncbi:MAG: gliding motility-associated ABC transporter ATP-binding subunit GldA [Bacteroidetes bacterium]|nr:gliding motility-associated ABC transporter ATP-binding subunit GldA [Bacteroidota bacterium]